MRFIIYGAGAVGGVIGGRLAEHGHETVLIARGSHLAAIRERGLTLISPEREVSLAIPAVEHPSEIEFRDGDVVILAMKTQDTEGALQALLLAAGQDVAIVCAQNCVENERLAARRFEHVYAVPVRLPATHLSPGVVQADSAPVSGILDVGRYPAGSDETTDAISAALERSTFSSRPDPGAVRHKYAKLLMNLGNAIDALCGPRNGARDLAGRARAEAVACYQAAGIDFASDEEDRARRGDLIRVAPVAGQQRAGGSTWQSLARGKRTLEVDYLNGEIVLLGRLHGVATPVNAALQRLANEHARAGGAAGTLIVADLEAAIEGLSMASAH
jgi:2-dehydropantoate 2-reductase